MMASNAMEARWALSDGSIPLWVPGDSDEELRPWKMEAPFAQEEGHVMEVLEDDEDLPYHSGPEDLTPEPVARPETVEKENIVRMSNMAVAKRWPAKVPKKDETMSDDILTMLEGDKAEPDELEKAKDDEETDEKCEKAEPVEEPAPRTPHTMGARSPPRPMTVFLMQPTTNDSSDSDDEQTPWWARRTPVPMMPQTRPMGAPMNGRRSTSTSTRLLWRRPSTNARPGRSRTPATRTCATQTEM